MAKIYKFPGNRKNSLSSASVYRDIENRELLCNLMETLINTYKQRIDELEGYKKEIEKENELHLKSPKELIREVKYLDEMFKQYGISCNFFRFYTKNDLEVIFYIQTNLVYVVKRDDRGQGMTYSSGEFIREFEGYPFTLSFDQSLLKIFDNQIENLKITIETLKNTEI